MRDFALLTFLLMFGRSREALYARPLTLFAGQMVVSCIFDVGTDDLFPSIAALTSALPFWWNDQLAVDSVLSAYLAWVGQGF